MSMEFPVELSFYCNVVTTEKEAFWRFVKALMSIGAKPTGEAWISQTRGDGHISRGKSRFELNTLDELFASADVKVNRLTLTHVMGLYDKKNTPEEVYLTGASPEAQALGDHSPFTLRIAGDLFTPQMIPRIIKRTLEIIDAVRPHYASFTWVDDYMGCPADLPRMTRALHDFYISRAFMGEAAYQKMLDVYRDASHYEFEHGVFITTSWRHSTKTQETFKPRRNVGEMIHNRWMNKKRYPDS